MAEKDRYTISREQAANRVRSKITGFDFASSANANIATAKVLGDVASSLADKTEEQNKRFDKLLKVLDFLPKDQLERRKQQKEIFINLARLTANIEQEAKNTNNPLEKISLRSQAKALRKQGRQFGGDYESSEARGLKENFAERFLKISPQQLRRGGGILGAYSNEIQRVTGIDKAFQSITGKRDDAFGRQVEQERLYPKAAELLSKTAKYSRMHGNIPDTGETGIETTKKGSTASRKTIGVSYGPILRQMTHTLLDIRDAIKHKGTSPEPTEGVSPKGLLTPEQKDVMDPRNWGIKKKGSQKGRKFWNKRDSSGRIVKPGTAELNTPKTPEKESVNVPKKKRSRLQKDFDKDFEKTRFGTSGNDKGMAEGAGTAAGVSEEASGGLLEGVGGSAMGGIASLGGEALEGVAGAIGAALPEIIGAVLTVGTIGLIGTAIYKHFHQDKPKDLTTATTGSNGTPWQSPETYGGTTITNGTVAPSTPATGTTIEQQLKNSSATPAVPPIVQNIVNNNSSGSRGSSEAGMPSVRTTDPSFIRWQDKRQTRIF